MGGAVSQRPSCRQPVTAKMAGLGCYVPVIDWHRRGLLPNSDDLTNDPRCHLVLGDFFAIAEEAGPFGPDGLDRYHAVLLDIDHTPSYVLHPRHAAFYSQAGLTRIAERLHPGGVFALWSDVPDDSFLATARAVFASCEAHEVRFPNHHTGGDAANTVYVARTAV